MTGYALNKDQNPKEEKRSGLWGSLLGFLGLGEQAGGAAAASEGGILGGGALGSSGGLGGLLATKTGLVAAITAGTALAGGLGVATYKILGPQSLAQVSSYTSLFSSKQPAGPAGSAGNGGQGGSGQSSSLAEFQQANGQFAGPQKMPAGYPAPGAQDRAGGSPNSSADASVTVIPGIPSSQGGAQAPANSAGNAGYFGARRNSAAPGAGSASPQSGPAAQAAAPGSQGGLQAFGAGVNGLEAAGGSLGAIHSGVGAQGSLRSLSESAGTNGFASASRQIYDGGASGQAAHLTGAGAGAGGAGSTAGALTNSPISNANPYRGGEQYPGTPAPASTIPIPWQNAIRITLGLIAGALMLLWMASKAKAAGAVGFGSAKVLSAIAAGMGAAIILLAMKIGSGPYAQTVQSKAFELAGVGILAASAFTGIGRAKGMALKGMGMAGMVLGMAMALIATAYGATQPRKSTCQANDTACQQTDIHFSGLSQL